MLPGSHSLVKYNTPLLVSTTKDSKGRKKKQLAPVSDKKTTQTEDILNSILPPREWTEEGQLWVQYVSSTPATRLDVISLQEQLDQKLQQRQARETGICPIREELYAQCFDEVIRQITINCGERGLLLLRVRDDIRMTIAAYQTLYESSIAFGMRKALMAEQRKRNMEAKIRELEQQCDEGEKQVFNLQEKIKTTEKQEANKRAEEEDKHREAMEEFKKSNEALKQNLESLLSVPTKK